MYGVNKAIIVGNVGKDPEMKFTASGSAIANFSIATSESWTDKNTGEKQTRTEWHRICAFGKVAEIIGEYVRKGSQVYIEGQIRTRKWADKESGQDRYSTEIVVDGYKGVMQLLGGRSDDSGATQRQSKPAPQQQQGFRDKPPADDGFADSDTPF